MDWSQSESKSGQSFEFLLEALGDAFENLLLVARF